MPVSEPIYEFQVERNVAVPMRDSTTLRADVYQPRAQGRYPVLVGRVGYKLRDWPMDFYTPMGEYYAQRGYVVVWQNVRGTFASEGRFHPFWDDAWSANRDGYDTIEWAATQPWSNSTVLESDLTVVGPVKAVLYGLSSEPDTDWVIRLCDVWPDGRSMWVCDGILRARYRNSLEREELMVPGQIYRFEVDMWATAQVFRAGHRLRIQVTSSDFPWYDRNLNTGGPFGEEVHGHVAVNTVFHDALRPSHVVLPAMS